MNWEAIGALAELIGAIAVIVSLLYLALQIRAQTRESRIQSSYQIIESFREAITSIQDSQRANLTIAGLKDIDSLKDAERLQFNAIAQRYFRVWEQAHYQNAEGRLESEMWEAIEAVYLELMGEKSLQAVWEIRKHLFRKSFREYVQGLEFSSYRLK